MIIRQTSFCLACLLAGSAVLSGNLLVNTRLAPPQVFKKNETVTFDLREHFQVYSDPGPVATFTLFMPYQEGERELEIGINTGPDGSIMPVDGEGTAVLMSYKLASGGSYNHAYEVYAEDFEWRQETVEYQLLPEEAPVTVANFLTYVADQAFDRTIVHRSEIGVLQAGGLRLYTDDPETTTDDSYLLEWIETLTPIPLEQTRDNSQGTLAMARQTGPDTATSQFFINVVDNSNSLRRNYAVFGELLQPETALPLLEEMSKVDVFNLTSFLPTAPVTTIPLYTPFWDDQGSYVRFQSISVPEGNADGVSYAWEFVDIDGEEGTSEDEAANQAVFNISLDGSSLVISRSDSGSTRIKVTGSAGGDEVSFETNLIGYNREALQRFPRSVIRQGGFLENDWFGFLIAEDYPYIQHLNHGYQYVADTTGNFLYLYDYQLGTWLYTTRTLYPHLYAYGSATWVWYTEGSGNGVNIPRWFYNYSTGAWFQG